MPVFNISGNAGAAGVLVSATGAATGSATSAADGTYTISGLIPGVYTITPTLAGAVFTPTSLPETIVASDITGVNFVASATGFSPSLTAIDNFTRPDAPTLGSNWQILVDSGDLSILSDLAVADPSLNGANIYITQKFAADQLAEVTLSSIAGETNIYVRSDITGTTGYIANLAFDTSNALTIFDVANGFAVIGVPITIASPASGDILSIQVVGTLITAFYNGMPVVSGTSAFTATGSPILGITSLASQSDTSVSLFQAGPGVPVFSIAGSVGASGAGASIKLSGDASATTTADGSGNYSFTGLVAGTYQVTPGLVGVAFSPSQRIVTISNADVTGVNFIVFTPSTGAGTSGSVIRAGAGFVTAVFTPRTEVIGTNLGTKILN